MASTRKLTGLSSRILFVITPSHPIVDVETVAWMRRRLRTTIGLGTILLCMQTLSAIPIHGEPDRARAENVPSLPSYDPPAIALPPSESPSLAASSPYVHVSEPAPKGRAVPPTGWRRTAQGWQHVSTWGPVTDDLSIGQRIIAQRDSETVWLNHFLTKIRRTPPGCFAIAQLLCVGILLMTVRIAKLWAPRDQTCPSMVR